MKTTITITLNEILDALQTISKISEALKNNNAEIIIDATNNSSDRIKFVTNDNENVWPTYSSGIYTTLFPHYLPEPTQTMILNENISGTDLNGLLFRR